MTPRISVIVPVYNAERFLDFCISSICQQTYRNLEILVINDGSTDSSLAICQKYAEKDQRIKLITTANYGVSHARNLGIQMSTGEYIGFVDSDDYISPYMYEMLVNLILKTKMSICSCGYYKVEEDCRKFYNILHNEIYNIYRGEESFLQCFEDSGYGGFPWNKLFSREIVLSLSKGQGYFDETIFYCEDQLFLFKLFTVDSQIAHLPMQLYYYRNVQSSAVNKVVTDKNFTVISAYEKMELIASLISKELLQKTKLRKTINAINLYIRCINKKQYTEESKVFLKIIREDMLYLLLQSDVKCKLKVAALSIGVCPWLFKACYKIVKQ